MPNKKEEKLNREISSQAKLVNESKFSIPPALPKKAFFGQNLPKISPTTSHNRESENLWSPKPSVDKIDEIENNKTEEISDKSDEITELPVMLDSLPNPSLDKPSERERLLPIIVRKRRSLEDTELRKIKVSKPSFNPLDGINLDEFETKREAYLAGYLNCLNHLWSDSKKFK